MMNDDNQNVKHNLNFNANKIRWLADSKLNPTDTFVIGSGENAVSLSIFTNNIKKGIFLIKFSCLF